MSKTKLCKLPIRLTNLNFYCILLQKEHSKNKKGHLFPPSQLAKLVEYWRGGTVAFMLEVESSTDDAFYSVTPQQSCEIFTPINKIIIIKHKLRKHYDTCPTSGGYRNVFL